jgi:RNA polymerase-binding transcription factor DksA
LRRPASRLEPFRVLAPFVAEQAGQRPGRFVRATQDAPAKPPRRTLLLEDAERVPISGGDGRCEQCDQELPAARRRNARHCSTRCTRVANYGRERAAA